MSRPGVWPMTGGRGETGWIATSRRRFARQVAFPLQEWWKGHGTLRLLREMEAEQWLSGRELLDRQAARLRALVAHAADTVPYYQRLFARYGLRPGDIRCGADLPKLPLLSKDDIRAYLDDTRSRTARRLWKATTSGSTGSPLTFYLGPTRVSSDVAARQRAEGWWEMGVGDLELAVWISSLEGRHQSLLRSWRDRLLRTRLFPAFELSPATLDRCIDHLLRKPYRRVFGYPGSIALLCERAAATRRDLRRSNVRAVFVTGEYLREEWRALISGSFGCPVANGYGGRDSGFVAHECAAGSMHVTADRLIIEIVDAHGRPRPAGESGEIVVTHLDTPEAPLLRYRTGDIGALSTEACRCGRGLPVLARIEGRITEFLVTPDGWMIHGGLLTNVLREVEGIRQFRVTQTRRDQVAIEIVAGARYQRSSETQMRDVLRRKLRGAGVDISYAERIAPDGGGKFRVVTSEIARDAWMARGIP